MILLNFVIFSSYLIRENCSFYSDIMVLLIQIKTISLTSTAALLKDS